MNRSAVLMTLNNSSHTPLLLQYRSWHRISLLLIVAVVFSGLAQPQVAAAQSCSSLLTDGGFEDGAAWESKNNDGFPLLSSQLAHSGLRGAYLGGRNNITDRLATQLTLPITAQRITLNLWWQLQSQENVTKHGDRLTIIVADKQGIPLQSLMELSGRNVTQDWRSAEFDLTRFAGQAIQLQFLASTDTEQITDFFLDDVEIIACDSAN